MNTLTTVGSENLQSYCFANANAFESAQRMATALSQSTLVPKEYQGKDKMPNCLIALEVASRVGASPLMVMQNLYIVHGRPSWSSQFIIAAINSCGRFKPLRFDLKGDGDQRSCVAWTIEKNVSLPSNIYTLEDALAIKLPVLQGPEISVSTAKKEGWYGKNGSKWPTLTDLMLHYRAASFFGRLYAPEILMGIQTKEEAEDIVDVTPEPKNQDLKNQFMNQEEPDLKPNSNKLDDLIVTPQTEEKEEVNPETGEVTMAERPFPGDA